MVLKPRSLPLAVDAGRCGLVQLGGGAARAADPGTGPTDRVVAVLVAGFGLLYALVARQPARLAPALWAGVLGKLGVLWVMVPGVLAGRTVAGTGAVLAGDLLFTLAFLAFLLSRRRAG